MPESMDPKSKYTSYLLFQKFKPELKFFPRKFYSIGDNNNKQTHTHKSVSEMAADDQSSLLTQKFIMSNICMYRGVQV